jgi:glucose-6-phosphate dehydrogenase assembly protein OpcA
LEQLSIAPRRLILDSALGDPIYCLNLLANRLASGQAVNDLNWLRLGSWHQTLAMVFDPPQRRDALGHVVQLDIDVEGDHPVQGLLLASWIADRLGWTLKDSHRNDGNTGDASICALFQRPDGTEVPLRVSPVPMGQPSIHPGQIVGLRMISKPEKGGAMCVILCSESGGCMRLEAGGMASMELVEEVVPLLHTHVEADMARLLEGGHDSSNPLLAAAAPLAAKLLS